MTLDETVNFVKGQTDVNDHNGALVTISRYLRRNNAGIDFGGLVSACEALCELHKFYGHMPKNLQQIREDLTQKIWTHLTPMEAKRFHDAT